MTNSNSPGKKVLNLKVFTTTLSIVLLCFLSLPLPVQAQAQKIDTVSSKAPNVIPTSPAGCISATNNFANMMPVTIDDTIANTVTSTINVAGLDPYLWDIDLTTDVTHSWNSDLQITLESPAGTVVTLTSDNGGFLDNVYDGTLWDDDANPMGQVPYTSNDGLATDHTYADLVTATPLVPEEALGAFLGENPNGNWTLTVADTAAGDGGSLNGWSMDITTFEIAPAQAIDISSNMMPVTIDSGPPNTVTSTINVAGLTNLITKVTLQTNITHTFSADLDITIQSPSGTVVTLTSDNGGSNNDVFNGTFWDDDANPMGQVPYTSNNGLVTDHSYSDSTTATPLVPEEALAAFLGESANGDWTLTISDDASDDGGSLNSWTLVVATGACPSAAAASIFGKVTSLSGRGVRNAFVSIVDLNGNTIATRRSNIFGYFKFDEIPVGQTYTVNTISKNYRFSPFVLNVNDNITGLVISAEN